jgi:hypothetical protein
VPNGQSEKRKHRYRLDKFDAGRWLAPGLTKANYQRRDHHHSNQVRKEPRAPYIPDWRRSVGIEQGHRRSTPHSGGRGCETGGGEKACYVTQVTKPEWTCEPPLEQPGHQYPFAGIAETFAQRGQKAPVAHEVGSDSADHNADQKCRIGAAT